MIKDGAIKIIVRSKKAKVKYNTDMNKYNLFQVRKLVPKHLPITIICKCLHKLSEGNYDSNLLRHEIIL